MKKFTKISMINSKGLLIQSIMSNVTYQNVSVIFLSGFACSSSLHACSLHKKQLSIVASSGN